MHNDILKQVVDRFEKSRRLRVAHPAADDSSRELNISRLSSHVKTVIGPHIRQINEGTEDLREATHEREFGGLGNRRQFERYVVERLSSLIGAAQTAYDFTVPSGSTIIAPPYDAEWQTGIADAFGAKSDGNVFTMSSPDEMSAAGIGFYLTTDEPVLAAITPQGTYQWNWGNLANVLPDDRTMGGMGITIYTDGSRTPTLSRQPILWSASGLPSFHGENGSGRIADAASPAFGLGTVPLAPALLNMVPGSRYLVWVWCWQVAHYTPHDGFSGGFLTFTMPLVTVNAGPPIVIH